MVLPRQLGRGAMLLPSHANDGAAEAMLVMVQCRYQDDLVAMLCLCQVMLAMTLPSHASDGAVEVTWPRCNVGAKSCW
jgi:hypothetical protein